MTLQYGKGLPERNRASGRVPVYGSGGIVGYHNKALVRGPGIIVGRKGSVGTVYFEARDFCPIDTVYYVDLKANDVDMRWLFYSLVQLQLGRLSGDTAVPGLNRDVAHRQVIQIPTLSTQRKIAAILSAYDDLIENNTRRIKILDEMAQILYREWFVNFRFPGHENVKMVESEMGMIPDGWNVGKLGDACHIIMGQSPKSEFYNRMGEGLPFHQGVTDFGARFPVDRLYCTVRNRIAERGDILFSVRAPVGRLNIANQRIVIGRGLCAIRSRNDCQCFVFHQFRELFSEEDMIGGGTIFKAVTKEDMRGIKILIPEESITRRFEEIAQPIASEMETLTGKNTNLRRTRDLLLPALISGDLGVSDLEVDVREEAS